MKIGKYLQSWESSVSYLLLWICQICLQNIWNDIFQNIVSFFSRSPICKYFLKILLFCVTCWEKLKNFSCFFHFFEKFFWWKSQQVTFFLLFFYMKKELYVGEIKKNVIRKSDFFCKIYRHVRHSLILICTLMSSMGKIDQHFEKMI